MSAPELLYGQRPEGTFGIKAAPLTRDNAGEVVLKRVQVHYSLFELPMASVLPRLPTALHPSVPAAIGLTVWKCPEGPSGSFSVGWVGVTCRTGIKPRHLIHGAWCDREDAATWLRSRYGLNCTLAAISSLETWDRAWSKIEVAGVPVVELVTENPQPLVPGSTVKYSPVLNAARIENAVTLVQMESAFDFHRVLRGVPRLPVYAAEAMGDAGLSPHYPISGTWAEVDITLLPPRFKLDPEIPAEQGGASRL